MLERELKIGLESHASSLLIVPEERFVEKEIGYFLTVSRNSAKK